MQAAGYLVLSLCLTVLGCHAGDAECVGFYKFEETQGLSALDSSPSKNHGHITGKPNRGDGKVGKCLNLSGEQCVVVPQDLSRWLGKSASLSCWLQTTAAGDDTFWKAPAITGNEEVPAEGFAGNNDIFWGWIDSRGRIGLQAGNGASATSKLSINDGKWHHIALTRNMDSGEVKVYVDGKLDATGVSEAGEKTTPFNSFGRREQSGPGGVCLKCMLDEIRIYKGILSAEEIRSQFESAK